MPRPLVSRDRKLNEIFYKCLSSSSIEYSLAESSILGLLNEEIGEDDIAKVKSSISTARDKIQEFDGYLNSFTNLDKGKIPSVTKYLASLGKALDTAEKELATASFEDGGGTFFGQKVTIPQIAQAGITIHTKASDFLKGFSDAMEKIQSTLAPLAPDDGKDKPLRELSKEVDKFPEEDKLKDGFKKAIEKSLGGGFFSKIKNFFTKAMSGAEKKIMDTLPELDESVVGEEVAEALLDSSLNDLSKAPPAPPEDPAALGDIAQQSVEDEQEDNAEAGGQSPEGGDDQGDTPAGEPPPPSEEEAEEEQEAANQELTSAVQDAAADTVPPGVAVMDALEAWYSGLSASSQQTLKAAGRYDALKGAVQTTMDGLAQTVEETIKSAMADWRSEHEETLIRSKRFAKKNFDTLEQTIPKLAAHMIKKMDESKSRLTKSKIRKTVFNFLDKRFKPAMAGVLVEQKNYEDQSTYRINKLAGLER